MENTDPYAQHAWKPERKYHHVGASPVAWDTAVPLAPASLDGLSQVG